MLNDNCVHTVVIVAWADATDAHDTNAQTVLVHSVQPV